MGVQIYQFVSQRTSSDAMTISTPGKIERTSRSPRLRDLSSKTVRDQIVSESRKDANSTLIRNRRVVTRAKQGK